jgi:hypothetical protein
MVRLSWMMSRRSKPASVPAVGQNINDGREQPFQEGQVGSSNLLVERMHAVVRYASRSRPDAYLCNKLAISV